jgi:transcriptional regulator with XRE-family HTH domain
MQERKCNKVKNSWSVIETLMHQHGVSKQGLAEIAGVGPSAVTKWASGGSIRIQTIYRIANHFGVDPVTILQAGITPEVKQGEIDWRSRALNAERKLKSLREAIRSFNDVVARLEGAL